MRGQDKSKANKAIVTRSKQASMAKLTANAVDVLPEGRFAQQLSEERPLRIKLGIDPTAADIHLGHAVVLQKLADFQAEGHQVILIIGDFTASIGDPSGRSKQRPILSKEKIDSNASTFAEQAFKILDPGKTDIKFNSQWLNQDSRELLQLLATTTVSQLLERQDFHNRYKNNQPISMLEMAYPLLQGYDSVAVKSDVEIGGTDQKFNLLLARDIQLNKGSEAQSILTMPVLPGTDGKEKMSKSLNNHIAITDPPADMFGKIMSISDDLMPEYYRLLLNEEMNDKRAAVDNKRQLAKKIITRFYDQSRAEEAEQQFNRVFVDRKAPKSLPVKRIPTTSATIHLPALLSEQFSISKGAARRLINEGAVRINDEKLSPGNFDVETVELDNAILRAGKRKQVRIELED